MEKFKSQVQQRKRRREDRQLAGQDAESHEPPQTRNLTRNIDDDRIEMRFVKDFDKILMAI